VPWTNHALDKFFGHRLSELTACGAEELPALANYLPAFLLTGIFQVSYAPKPRCYMFNLIRRAQQASYEYGQGRAFLTRYLESSNEAISPYYQALSHFEQCVALLVQAAHFADGLLPENLFKQGSHPDLERLNRVYNASKHMEGRIASGRLPTNALTAVWITNDGLASHDANVTFQEVRDFIIGLHEVVRQIVEELPKRVHAHFAAQQTPS
jgi:hypothetical protein